MDPAENQDGKFGCKNRLSLLSKTDFQCCSKLLNSLELLCIEFVNFEDVFPLHGLSALGLRSIPLLWTYFHRFSTLDCTIHSYFVRRAVHIIPNVELAWFDEQYHPLQLL